MTDVQQNAPANNAGAQKTGNFQNAQVKMVDMNSLIQNAAEELTSLKSEDAEKEASERDVEEGRKAESLERVLQVSEVDDILRTLGDLDKRDLFRSLKALIQQQHENPDQFLKDAKEEFEQPAHQYALLKSLVAALKARGAPPEQIKAAEQAVADLMKESGKEITAALNIGEEANNFKSDLGDVSDLRNTYTTNVHDYQSISSVLNDLVQRFGEEKLENSINFMLKALASDLDSGGSSINETQLQLIMNDMNRLKTMATMLGNCGFLVKNVERMLEAESA
ncbi:MAG: type III secretion system gatekeeper subunit SctW [Pseudomonadota bacterium]